VVAAAARAIDVINHQLEERVSHEQIEAAQAVLIALTEIKTNAIGEGTGRRRTPRELRRISPIFQVRNLGEALLHYRSLGFDAFPDEDGDHYGFAQRDGVEVHLAVLAQNEPPSPAAAYLYVRDADALFEEWSRPEIAGITNTVEATPYGLREGSHVDPDGNVIRFGSPVEE
jgi:catechol 2,3-dioxygenase-like lactoylglutathione lyase family enzyme